MAAQNSSGIQTLLEAEKDASKIVQKARAYRVQRLKDARSEATKEIDAYKKQKDSELDSYLKEHEGNSDQIETSTENETKSSLKSVQEAFGHNKDGVITRLMDTLFEVKPHIHQNYKQNKAAREAAAQSVEA